MVIAPIRNDSQGLGHFGAKRGDRHHQGLDLAMYPDTRITAPETGLILPTGRVYSDKRRARYKIVNLKVDSRTLLRFFYAVPVVKVKSEVDKGSVIARVQNISKAHSPKMLNHVHIGLKINGEYVDPYPWLVDIGWLIKF